MKAKVCHFYSWSYKDVDQMPYSKFLDYWLAITPIEAQKALVDIKIAQFPHLKKNRQRLVFQQFKRQAYSTIKRYTGSMPSMSEVVESFKKGLAGGG